MKTAHSICITSAAALTLSGCISMTPATYMVSPDIKQSLRAYEGSKAHVVEVAGPSNFDPMCRAAGNLRFESGMTVPQFVEKAFNDEFKYAGIYAPEGVSLRGRLTRIDFSSSASIVNGYWDLALSLESSNGKSLSEESRYDFESGFNAVTACNNTSQALATAVQALIRKTVTDPRFGSLVRQ
jgi:hypothetical protein